MFAVQDQSAKSDPPAREPAPHIGDKAAQPVRGGAEGCEEDFRRSGYPDAPRPLSGRLSASQVGYLDTADPTTNPGTVLPGHTLSPAGIVTPVSEYPTRWTPDLDERLLFGARAGTPNDKIGEMLGFTKLEVNERLEHLCPAPRDMAKISDALKRVKEQA